MFTSGTLREEFRYEMDEYTKSVAFQPLLPRCSRQRQPERRSLSRLARRAQVSVHRAREISADRQSEPRPSHARSLTALQLHERLEHALQLVGRNPHAGVG